MDITLLLLQSVYFVVPAYFANMAPVLAKKLNLLKKMNFPVDMNATFYRKPIFGRHKTFRGLIVGITTGIILAYIQTSLYNLSFFKWISITDYSNPFLLGFLLGMGAMLGDLLKSFFKRRIGIPLGRPFIPFDQIDFIIGAYIFVIPFYYSVLSLNLVITSIVVSFFLHILVNHVSFYLKVRKEKW